MSTDHTPESHSLIPDVLTRTPRLSDRRRERPPAHYKCSCGARLWGASRRQARGGHQLHRADVAARQLAQRGKLQQWADKASQL